MKYSIVTAFKTMTLFTITTLFMETFVKPSFNIHLKLS